MFRGLRIWWLSRKLESTNFDEFLLTHAKLESIQIDAYVSGDKRNLESITKMLNAAEFLGTVTPNPKSPSVMAKAARAQEIANKERKQGIADKERKEEDRVENKHPHNEAPQAPRMTEPTASAHWDTAIAAAENGRPSEALEEFRIAIEMNPDYYISVIQPRSAQARVCWEKVVEQYVRDTDTKAGTSKIGEHCCGRCAKDIGIQWHYEFESISFAGTVGAQCPQCGLVLCRDDLRYGPDKNYEPCPNCKVPLATLTEGPAYSSMVEQARRERRYRGQIKEPSFFGRTMKTG